MKGRIMPVNNDLDTTHINTIRSQLIKTESSRGPKLCGSLDREHVEPAALRKGFTLREVFL
jgi:hypothetical protein